MYHKLNEGVVVRKGSPRLWGLGSVDVWCADVGVVVGSRILGEVPKFYTLVIRPREGEISFGSTSGRATLVPLPLQAIGSWRILEFEVPELEGGR